MQLAREPLAGHRGRAVHKQELLTMVTIAFMHTANTDSLFFYGGALGHNELQEVAFHGGGLAGCRLP